jgi:zinc transporter ZupT
VSIILRNHGGNRSALRWLLIDAGAPVAGAASTIILPFRQDALGLCLALFAGSFLYIGASDLLPDSYAPAVLISRSTAAVCPTGWGPEWRGWEPSSPKPLFTNTDATNFCAD